MPPLPASDRAALEHASRSGPSRLVRQRSQIVLLAYEMANQTQIAQAVRCSRATVNRTLQRFRPEGVSAIVQRPPVPPRALWKDPAWRQLLATAMEQGPRVCGVLRPAWTAPLLADYLQQQTGRATGERTVRRGLAALDYVCRRGTWTVRHKAEEQPNYYPKRKGSKRS